VNFQRNTLASKLIDHGQDLHRTTVLSAVEDKVNRPDVIGTLGLTARDAAFNGARATFLTLFRRYFETSSSPKSVDAFEIDRPTFLAEQTRDQAIAVARELANKL